MPLVVYATVEMHESDRVLRQFGWRQQILPSSQDMKELHKVDMRGKDNTDWLVWHKEHIEVWDRRMQSIPIREQFFSMDTAATDDYLAWFRTTDKLYMLSPEERSWQIRVKRSRRMPEHTRKGYDYTTSSSSALAKGALPMAAQYLGHFSAGIYFAPSTSPHTTPLCRCDAEPHVGTNTDISTATDANANAAVNGDVDVQYISNVPGFEAPQGFMPIVTQTPRASLFYKGGSLSQQVD